MDFLDKYNIQFNVLVEGENDFKFSLNKEFFEHFSIIDIDSIDINTLVKVEKSTNLLIFRFHIIGTISVPCDRCLDIVNLDITNENELYVKLVANEIEEQAENMLIIPKTENEINIAHYLYEFIYLSLPIKKIHPDNEDGDSTCNEEMLSRLENYNSNKSNNVSVWNELNKFKNGTS